MASRHKVSAFTHSLTHPALVALSRKKTDLGGAEEHERDHRRVVVTKHLAAHLDQASAEVVAVVFDLFQLLFPYTHTHTHTQHTS